MRPCRQCRAPIENRTTACPQCGAAQNDGPKVNPDPPRLQTRRERVRQLIDDLNCITGLVPALGLTIAAVPLVVLGLSGYFAAGNTGAGVGIVAAIALLVGIAIWAETGG